MKLHAFMVDIVAAYLNCVSGSELPNTTRTTHAVKICCNNIYHKGMQFY